ncbi:MAG: acetyl-CoA carboxylase biotin carboxyl carrier protein subunit [Proteobacteria bacterium]|nr:acetyl-CoA carboxylase biotin carboxyl carrier protein subunit [Pseudomonadota bacterium]HQR04253.1 hypothetical protein [Rhodocyclaceae bacterium]
MHHGFVLDDQEFNVELSRAREGYRLHFEGQVIPLSLRAGDDGGQILTVRGHSEPVRVAVDGDWLHVHLAGSTYTLRYQHPLDRLAAGHQDGAADHIVAPMPGSIVAVLVRAGDAVVRGQSLLVMESMKMETTITAPRDGVVDAVHFDKGQSFDRDTLLLDLVAEPRP